jgi:DNA-binding NarL/FixJ family response regulator
LVRLALARGQHEQARAIIEQGLQSPPASSLDRVPLLALFVEVSLLQGNLDSARQSVEALMQIAETAQSDVLYAQAELAEGQMRHYAGNADAASSYQAVLKRLPAQENSLLAGRARFEMAQLLATSDHVGAVVWAKAALATFERMGAKHDADRTAGLLRQLGNSTRSGPRSQDVLTVREGEVLSLIANGMTNREIAERLVISPKTVEHHVSQILSKLGLRSRAEAAAFASKHPDEITHPQR